MLKRLLMLGLKRNVAENDASKNTCTVEKRSCSSVGETRQVSVIDSETEGSESEESESETLENLSSTSSCDGDDMKWQGFEIIKNEEEDGHKNFPSSKKKEANDKNDSKMAKHKKENPFSDIYETEHTNQKDATEEREGSLAKKASKNDKNDSKMAKYKKENPFSDIHETEHTNQKDATEEREGSLEKKASKNDKDFKDDGRTSTAKGMNDLDDKFDKHNMDDANGQEKNKQFQQHDHITNNINNINENQSFLTTKSLNNDGIQEDQQSNFKMANTHKNQKSTKMAADSNNKQRNRVVDEKSMINASQRKIKPHVNVKSARNSKGSWKQKTDNKRTPLATNHSNTSKKFQQKKIDYLVYSSKEKKLTGYKIDGSNYKPPFRTTALGRKKKIGTTNKRGLNDLPWKSLTQVQVKELERVIGVNVGELKKMIQNFKIKSSDSKVKYDHETKQKHENGEKKDETSSDSGVSESDACRIKSKPSYITMKAIMQRKMYIDEKMKKLEERRRIMMDHMRDIQVVHDIFVLHNDGLAGVERNTAAATFCVKDLQKILACQLKEIEEEEFAMKLGALENLGIPHFSEIHATIKKIRKRMWDSLSDEQKCRSKSVQRLRFDIGKVQGMCQAVLDLVYSE